MATESQVKKMLTSFVGAFPSFNPGREKLEIMVEAWSEKLKRYDNSLLEEAVLVITETPGEFFPSLPNVVALINDIRRQNETQYYMACPVVARMQELEDLWYRAGVFLADDWSDAVQWAHNSDHPNIAGRMASRYDAILAIVEGRQSPGSDKYRDIDEQIDAYLVTEDKVHDGS